MHYSSLLAVYRFLLGLCLVGALSGQELMRFGQDGYGFLPPGDLAVLSSDDNRDDLPCEVEQLDPELEFDLNFRAGYNAKIPLSALAGGGNSLRVVFRITALGRDEKEPVYMHRRYTVPPIDEGASGSANLPGRYRLGPGQYRVDWLMRDRAEKVCSSSWEVAAETVEGFEKLAANPTESMIAPFSDEAFYEEPPVMRTRGQRRHVKLLINFTPTNPSMAGLNAYDLKNVVSMARAIVKEPDFGLFSIVAYQSQRERVFYEQERAARIDFPALGDALANVQGGTVDIETLQDKESSRRFVKELLETHVGRAADEPDAIIFLGPKLVFDRSPATNVLAPSRLTSSPVFYFIYNLNPRAYPWRDAISAGLNNHALEEFDISSAKEFGRALQSALLRLGGEDAAATAAKADPTP